MNSNQTDYQEFFEFSLDAIVCSDHTGHITLWNPAAEKMFGYNACEAIGQPLTILIPHETQAQHNAAFEHFMLTGKSANLGKAIEINARKKDASVFPVELSLSAKKTPQGYKISAILRDITERKQLESKLKSNASKLQSIFSNISNISVQGYDKNRKVVFWNQASEEIYGYAYDEAIGQRLEDLIIPEAMKEGVVSSVNHWHE
ncbi:MAG: PAS domain S-box protein, partial [Mariprofundaceae bacterium]|nr:PAS domain S-box protein [Mariprofundaceae bacterium]